MQPLPRTVVRLARCQSLGFGNLQNSDIFSTIRFLRLWVAPTEISVRRNSRWRSSSRPTHPSQYGPISWLFPSCVSWKCVGQPERAVVLSSDGQWLCLNQSQQLVTSLTEVNASILALNQSGVRTSPPANQMRHSFAFFLVVSPSFWRHLQY